MKGYLVDAGGDVIPQRLHVVDLVFNRQSVKPRRRQWEGISHGTPPEYTTHRVTGCDRLSHLIRSRLVFAHRACASGLTQSSGVSDSEDAPQ